MYYFVDTKLMKFILLWACYVVENKKKHNNMFFVNFVYTNSFNFLNVKKNRTYITYCKIAFVFIILSSLTNIMNKIFKDIFFIFQESLCVKWDPIKIQK